MNLFDLAKDLYVYAIDFRYIGEPEEMKPEEAERRNKRLEEMRVQARWLSVSDHEKEYAGLVQQVTYGEVATNAA